jgi:predicted TPR repeat methyltransferase
VAGQESDLPATVVKFKDSVRINPPRMQRPTWNPSILVSPVEDGYVAYDAASDQLHHLNPVAALLSELCDGTRTVEQIRDLVAPMLPAPEQAAGQIERWVAEAAKAGLLALNGDSTTRLKEMSPDELSALASRLRDHGKIQPAFLCQQRAAERAPGDARKWSALGELAHILGRRDDARMAYGKYLELEPDDAEVRHIMTALRDGPAPSRVPDDCIQQLYSRFSSFYEKNVCDDLGYQGPEHLQTMVESVLGARDRLDILDLGCGSGLAGVRFNPRAATMIGVDLSPEMIELARARNLYDRLEVAEITAWLARAQQQFDLIVACDSFIYFGDLNQVVAPAARLLRPSGVFAFTVEKGARQPFALTDSGRYEHHPDHVREVARAAGLEVVQLEESFLRMEYGEEVTGLFVVLRKGIA